MPTPASHLVERFRSDLEALTGTPAPRLGVALSGGPDSLALLLLAAAAFAGNVEAATVDHQLRPEAADEADLAARHCAALGVPHRTLRVEVTSDGDGVQAAARAARYRALGGWAAERGLGALLTGHHLDDQAETLVMRLLRGSGVAGLSGVRASAALASCGSVVVHRPLLGWRRAELAAIVAEAGLEAADDPGNRDETFDRARIRRHIAATPWLDPVALARSAAALAEADAALEQTARQIFDARAERRDGMISLPMHGIARELRRRVAMLCLRSVAPAAAPRGHQIGALLAGLDNGECATLAGVKCTGGESWRFEPAPPRRPSP